MFRIPKSETFAVTVQASLATDRPGRYAEGSFTAVFKRPSTDRYIEIIEGLRDIVGDGMSVRKVVEYKADVMRETLDRVEGIGDEAGKELPPEDQLRTVLETLPLLNAAFDAFAEAYTGSAAKNLKPSPNR
jgi:hypothetical protein